MKTLATDGGAAAPRRIRMAPQTVRFTGAATLARLVRMHRQDMQNEARPDDAASALSLVVDLQRALAHLRDADLPDPDEPDANAIQGLVQQLEQAASAAAEGVSSDAAAARRELRSLCDSLANAESELARLARAPQ